MKCKLLMVSALLTVFACEQEKKQEKRIAASVDELYAGEVSTSVPDLSPSKKKEAPALPTGAQRFIGEYLQSGMTDVKLVIYAHPMKEGYLAYKVFIRDKSPGALALIYDEENDQLTSRHTPEQPSYLTIDLVKGRLTKINYDMAQANIDTTVYLHPSLTQ